MDRGLIGRKFRESSDRVSLIELIQSDEWIELKAQKQWAQERGPPKGNLLCHSGCSSEDDAKHLDVLHVIYRNLVGFGKRTSWIIRARFKKERKKGTVNISELVPPYLARNNQPLGLMHSSALSQWKPVADHKFVKFGPLVPFLACFKSKPCFKSEEESIPGISLALLIPSANSNLSASARFGFSSVGWSPFLVSAPSEPRPLRSKWHWGCWRRQPGRGGRRKCWIYFINCEGGIFDSLKKCASINISMDTESWRKCRCAQRGWAKISPLSDPSKCRLKSLLAFAPAC